MRECVCVCMGVRGLQLRGNLQCPLNGGLDKRQAAVLGLPGLATVSAFVRLDNGLIKFFFIPSKSMKDKKK